MNGKILKASAGTGKTYRLSLEYIASLFRGEEYQNILVMTFTKKATAEIKERIVSFLKKLDEYEKDGEELKENIEKLYPDIVITRKKIKEIYLEILENQDRLRIYTIDSFINNIFKNIIAPYLKIFSYEIIGDDENDEILIRCFEKIVQNREYFNRFLKFFENRTEKDIKNYIEILKRLIESRWKIIAIINSKKLKEKERIERGASFEKLIKYILETLEQVMVAKKENDLKNYLVKDFKWMLSFENINEEIEENWNEILKKEKCWNARKVTKKFESETEILEKLYGDFQVEVAKEIYNTEILNYEKEIKEFLETFYLIYDEIKFSEKKFTHLDVSSYVFNYIEKKELNLIKDGEITKYFMDIFESDFSTVFIDEFQDTSILQWWILKGVISKSKNFICVGDEKQSIYGWRGGEKALFENLSKIVDGEEESLNISYRSSKNVVEFTNGLFEGISDIYLEETGKCWNFEKIKAHSEEEGYVEVVLPEESPVEVMVESLKEKFRGEYKNMAIIARNNSQLKEISEALDEEKIPYIIESNDSIIIHRAIEPIYQLLAFLVKKDLYSLLVFLRNDLIKIDEKGIKGIVNNFESLERFIFENKEEYPPILTPYFKIFEKIRELNLKGLRNKDILNDIVEKFNITKKYFNESDLKNIFYIFELSKEFDDICSFYFELEKEEKICKYPQITLESNNAITLLTIHKSKGLEFETVYFYHQVKGKGVESGIRFHIDLKYPFKEIENYIFIDKKAEKILKKLHGYSFLDEMELKSEEEEINNLYVATTRAKRNLFIIADTKRNRYLDAVIKEEKIGKFEKIEKEELKKEDDIKKLEISFRESDELEEQEEIERKIDIVTEEKRVLGNAIHYYLEFIIRDLENEHKIARKKTLSKFASIIGEKKLETILNSEKFKNIFKENSELFSSEWDYIYPEYTIYKRDEKGGELKRLDRLMVKKAKGDQKGKVLVIDYKTGEINKEQLDEYLEILSKQLSSLNLDKDYLLEGKFLEIKI